MVRESEAATAAAAATAEHTETELVLRGEYLSRYDRYDPRGLHDGDVVRVLPGTAHWARPGDLVAAAAPGGRLAVGVLAPDADERGGPVLLSDWDGPGAVLCCGGVRLLGLCKPVRLVRGVDADGRAAYCAPAAQRRLAGHQVRRVPLPYRREAREAVRPVRRWLGVVAALAPLPLAGLRGLLAA